MVKFIHTSDWHLGHCLYQYDRSAEQQDFLRQLVEIVHAEQPDALLVCGDVFQTAQPTYAAVRLYNEWMLKLRDACQTMTIVVIAGNHDSGNRLACDSEVWQRAAGVHTLGHTTRTDDGMADLDRHIIAVPAATGDTPAAYIAAVPYTFIYNYPPVSHDAGDNRQQAYFQALLDRIDERNTHGVPVVLMAHLAVSGSDFTGHDQVAQMQQNSYPLTELGEGYDYAALGHIHRPQHPGNNPRVRYCGTPIAMSFDEQCSHSVSVVTLERHGDLPHVRTIPITNLHPLHTIPAREPVELDEALELLAAEASKGEESYLRLNVLTQGYLPQDARERVNKVIGQANCRVCEIKTTPRNKATGEDSQHQMTLSEFKQRTPLEIADEYIKRKSGEGMSEQQRELFNIVFNEINEENRQ